MICVSEHERAIILDILKEYAPDCEARAFGSRYKWTSSDSSDLDLALTGKTKLGLSRLGRIRDAFEESELPFRVDVLDWHCLSKEFQTIINSGYEVIYTPGKVKKEQWRKVRLGEVAVLHYGKALQATKRIEGGVPVFSSAGIIGYHNQALIESKGIVVGRKGSIGTVYYSSVPFFCIDTAYYIIPDHSYDLQYLFYLLKTLKLETLNEDSAVPGLNRQTVYSLEFLLPPLSTQQAIAATLSCLDEKIALNNRINANLEAQAQAIFKSWFVNFEPFKDGGFVDSELGRIPKGWRIKTLADVCEKITKGTTPTTLKRNFTASGIKFVKAESINNDHSFDISKFTHIDDDTNRLLMRSVIIKDDILFTMAGTIGRFAYVTDTILPANTNQAVAIIRINPTIVNPKIIYSFFIAEWHKQYFSKRIQQSVQSNLSLGNIGNLPLLLPKQHELSKYAAIIIPLFDMIQCNIAQSRTLAAIRDALLPKLMSGEIEVEV